MANNSKTMKTLQTLFSLSTATALGALCVYLFAPEASVVDPITTATVQTLQPEDAPATKRPPPSEQPVRDRALLDALRLLDNGDIEAVLKARNALDEGDLDFKTLSWLIATSGHSTVPIEELRKSKKQLDGWPNHDLIEKKLEAAMARDPLSVVRLRQSLGDTPPQSFQAAFAVARTYMLTRNYEKARALIVPYWHWQVLSGRDELKVLSTFEDALTERDHEIRYFNMMSRNRVTAAGRIANQLGWENLHSAWAAVIRRQKGADNKMNKLEASEKKLAAYAFMRTEYLRRSDKDDEAIAIIQALPDDLDFLINPDAWWDERRIISRHKFETGDAQAAYDLVAAHQGGSDATQIDAAFHAGWYALRGLKKPDLAAEHFKTIIDIANGDISKARGYYWLGRALGNGEEAKSAYKSAAAFQTTYYGWLASEELGEVISLEHKPTTRGGVASKFLEPLQAAERLSSIGQHVRARALYVAMGWSWTEPEALSVAAEQATKNDDHFAALKIAKAANWRGIEMGPLTHPLGAISDANGLTPLDLALAYAIARQESEFNIGAVSNANARGLMQVLPGTAKEMARQIGVDYEASRLTTDARYNAQLGIAYLNQQLDKFGGSYILTFAAYNAGPARAKEWIERFGDPRGQSLYAVIDWVEMIPFPETRSYVQRIMENLQVYKTKLKQETSIANDLRFGATRSN